MRKKSETAFRRRRPKWAVASGTEPEPAEQRYYSRTIGRAFDVLEAFTGESDSLTLKDLSRIVRLPESSLFRVLLTLQTRGYLSQGEDGSYQLSRKVLLGKLMEWTDAIRGLARPEMQALVSRFNETVSLACLIEDRIQVLECFETFHEVRITNCPGRVLPPHCSALGKAITAFQERTRMDRILEIYGLSPRTPATISDRQRLLDEFDLTRKRGYAFDREESVSGGICVSAPLSLGKGEIVAAISVSTPTARMTRDREAEVVEAVKHAAAEISRKKA